MVPLARGLQLSGSPMLRRIALQVLFVFQLRIRMWSFWVILLREATVGNRQSKAGGR